MAVLSLYRSCCEKIAILLRDGMYNSCLENPFSTLPRKLVNDIMSKTSRLMYKFRWRANNLKPLLTSGHLVELKMHAFNNYTDVGPELIEVFRILKSSSQNLEVFHLTVGNHVILLRNMLEKTLGELLSNCPNLKDLRSEIRFDLAALRNCRKLRFLKLLFLPEEEWSNFLVKENDKFQKHACLEFFTVSKALIGTTPINYRDIVTILKNCPVLSSLGSIETSGALSLLHKETKSQPLKKRKSELQSYSTSGLKLRTCYWRDLEWVTQKKEIQEISRVKEVKEAIKYHPVVEELNLEAFYSETVSCLRNLKNLTYLNIKSYFGEDISQLFGDACKEIGYQLKHLSFEFCGSIDISAFLKQCPNLVSLKSNGNFETLSASSPVHLPHLQHLTLCHNSPTVVRKIFCNLFCYNKLTDLFLPCFDEDILNCFLENNSLENLKVACLGECITEKHGIKKLLLNSPKLEKVKIFHRVNDEKFFKKIVSEINDKIIFDRSLNSSNDFIERKFYGTMFCCR